MTKKKPKLNRYASIIQRIFVSKHQPGTEEILFDREDLFAAARALRITPPKNPGDLLYSFRYRSAYPPAILANAPRGKSWIILGLGRSRYRFLAIPTNLAELAPNQGMVYTKIPDATPGIIARYAKTDEQALLAKVRYNRLIDIFTGVTCYPLQSHLRTSVSELGQVETDELYVGIDKRGAHYVFPVQAKGGKDRLGVVQVYQDFALCQEKFPELVCRPISAQFLPDRTIALFEFVQQEGRPSISVEKHYRLVPESEVSTEDLAAYRKGS